MMNHFRRLGFAGFCCQLLLMSGLCWGQLPNPRLHTVYPCGGQVGTTAEVTIAGADLDEAAELIFSHSGITGTPKLTPATDISPARPIPNQFAVQIAADVPPGVYEVRVRGRFGLSSPRRFVVSATPELTCDNQNRSAETAMALPLDQAISARALANGVQFYKFSLEQGEKVTVECQTRALDSKMNPVMVVMDLSGNEIARARSASFEDAVLYFQAPLASQYLLSVRDAVFSGGNDYFYRLSLTKKPHLLTSHPRVIQRDTDPEVELLGWNLPGGQPIDGFDRPLESIRIKASSLVQMPRSPAAMPPRAASYPLDWIGVAWGDNGVPISNQIPLYWVDQPVFVESSTQDVVEVGVPSEISGRFLPHNETDEYRFAAKQGETIVVEAFSHRLGKTSDLILIVEQQVADGNGNVTWKNVAVHDDPSSRGGGVGPDFSTSTDDPGLSFQVPADGVYRISLKDQFGTYDRDPMSVYRLSIRKPQPDFRLVCHPFYGRVDNGNQIFGHALALRRGGRAHVQLEIQRLDGFNGSVTLDCQGLPPGIDFGPRVVPEGETTVHLVFHAAEDAPIEHGRIQITGQATIDAREVTHEATYGRVVWDTGNKTQTPAWFRRAGPLEISIIPEELAAVTVEAGDGQELVTSIGGKLSVPVQLIRRNGFVEPLKLVVQNLPGNLKPGDLTIDKEKNEGAFEIFVKDKNTAARVYEFFLKGDAKFQYSRNPQAAVRAEAELKRLTEMLTAATQRKAELEKESAAILESLKQIDARIEQARKMLEAEKKQVAEATAKLDLLAKAIQAAKPGSGQTIVPVILAAAEAHLNEQRAALEKNESLQAAEAGLKQVEQEKTNLMATIKSQADEKNALEARIQAVTAAQKSTQGELDNFKKQSMPQDRFAVAVSNPLRLRVVSAPFVIKPIEGATGNVESEIAVELQIERQFGFQDPVNISFQAPAGIQLEPVVIPQGQSTGTMRIKIGKECPAGSHPINLTAAAKFNNVDVQATASFPLQVNVPTAAEKAKP